MIKTRLLVVVPLVLCLCTVPLQASTDSGSSLAGSPIRVPLPQGRELGDAELLAVEGEIAFLLALLLIGAGAATGAAGGAMVYENWWDEDYGIDSDDWRTIGGAALGVFMATVSGGVVGHYVGPM
jgi:hypothetical protein